MGATSIDNKTTRKRGRPMTKTTDEDAALKVRRERNRTAQHIFRKRKQAAEEAQGQRMHRLEEIVEKMSAVFVSFADEVLLIDAVARDAGVMKSLRASMEMMLRLATEAAAENAGRGEDEMEMPLRQVSEDDKSSPDDNVDYGNKSLIEMSTMEVGSGTIYNELADTLDIYPQPDLDFAKPLDYPFMIPFPGTLPSQPVNNLPSNDLNFGSDPSFTQGLTWTPLPPQIFGNGWPGDDLLATVRNYDRSHNICTTSLPPDSFPVRLTEASIALGVVALAQRPPSTTHTPLNTPYNIPPDPLQDLTPLARYMFSSTLQFRSRDFIHFKLRYILGPGRKELYRLADAPFTQSRSDPCPSKLHGDKASFLAGGYHLGMRAAPENWLSAVGVHEQLKGLGAKMVDRDTLELSVVRLAEHQRGDTASPDSSLGGTSQGSHSSKSSSPPTTNPQVEANTWPFTNYFPIGPRPAQKSNTSSFSSQTSTNTTIENDLGTTTVTKRLSIPLLIANLAQIAVCVARCPAYPKAELGRVIEDSTTTVHDSGVSLY